MEILIDIIKKCLADNFSLYVKVLGFHWNITGKRFIQLHDFFKLIYTDLQTANDFIAEHIRALDSFAPGSMSRFLELSEIKCETKILKSDEMLNQLIEDNKTIINTMKVALKLAQKYEKEGLVNYLGGRIEIHEKYQWMFKSLMED